jgi:hypothetical protein
LFESGNQGTKIFYRNAVSNQYTYGQNDRRGFAESGSIRGHYSLKSVCFRLFQGFPFVRASHPILSPCVFREGLVFAGFGTQ